MQAQAAGADHTHWRNLYAHWTTRSRVTCFRAWREEARALTPHCVRAFSRLLANQEKPIVRYAVGIFSIDRDQSSAGALINCSYRVSRYLEPSVRYHPLTSFPMDFELEVFAFALAYAKKNSKNQAKPGLIFSGLTNL